MTSNKTPEKEVTIVLSTLKDIAEAVIGAAEMGTLKQVLQQIAYVAQQLVKSRYAALGIPSEHGTMKFFEVVGLSPEEIAQIAHPPIGRGLLGVIMDEREILRVPRIQDDPRSSGFPENHPHMERLLGVPIQAGTQLFGMLYLTDRVDGEVFSEQDQWLVESLAGYAALAIAGTRLSEQHGRLTLLEERERVGMELHDGIIQSLYAIGIQLQLLRRTHPLVSDELGKATESLDAVIEDIRGYILNLKVSNYERQTLHEALADVVARLRLPEALSVRLNAPDILPPFPSPTVEAVCQIAYEALSNVARHSHATQVAVDATLDESLFQLVISDNGRGFSMDAPSERDGLGLRNMMHRARIYGGDLKIESVPGDTRLILRLPL